MGKIKGIIACECSNVVAGAFRKRGHYVISADLKPNEVSQEFHYQGDVFDLIGKEEFDYMIAFPPCTHLAASGNRHRAKKKADGREAEAIEFFLRFTRTGIKFSGIENPVGVMSSIYRKPDQIIQPWYFGDSYQKTTCLWLTGFPKLFHAKEPDLFNEKVTHVDPGEFVVLSSGAKLPKWYSEAKKSSKEETSTLRSRMFPSIAEAMAEQWGAFLEEKIKL